MRFYKLIYVCTFLLFIGCKPELENNKDEVLYFDLKKIIHEQANKLSKSSKKIQKFIRHNKQREINLVQVNNWQQELKIFEEANLNRPIYKELYLQKDSTAQDISYRIYTATKADLQVRFLKLGYEKNKLKSIEGNLLIRNVLYTSEKNIRLNFDDNELLAGFGIKGGFEVVYGLQNDYEIDAIIK